MNFEGPTGAPRIAPGRRTESRLERRADDLRSLRRRWVGAALGSVLLHLVPLLLMLAPPRPPAPRPRLALEGPEVEAKITTIRPEARDRNLPDLPRVRGAMTAVEVELRPEMMTIATVQATRAKPKPAELRAKPVAAPAPVTAEESTEPVRIVLREDFSSEPASPLASMTENFQIVTLVRPDYPRDAIRAEQQGLIKLEVRVGLSGRVLDAKVSESPGFRALEHAAVIAVMQWEFKPLSVDGKPVPFVVVVPFRFRLFD